MPLIGSIKIQTGWNIHSNEHAKKNLPEAIAIGTNSYARTGAIEIGAHTLAENQIAIGDTTADKLRQYGVASTTLGTNSYTGGGFATTIGSYNVQTNQYEAKDSDDTLNNATKNAFATVIGTFNSNESLSSDDVYTGSVAGVANMISGTANKVTNSNGAIVMGAGNSVKNSIDSFDTSAYRSLFKSAADMQKALMKGVASSAGGATLVIGGANKAENTLKTQILGVNNTVTGTEDTPADYNMIDGFNTTVNGASHLYTIGTNNKITNAKNTILFGDDYQNASGLTDSVIIGNNRVKGDEKAEFAYFNNQKNIVSIGNKNVLDSTDGSISIGNNNFMWRSGGQPEKYGYDTGNVAIGNNTYINSYLNQGDSIVIGKNATVINMGGSLEKAFAFGTPEGKDYSGSIAIGQNSYARSGSTMIGIHNYQGKLGDLDIDFTKDKSGGHSGIGEYQESIDATTIGNNSYNNGVFSTVVGSYTAVSGLYHNQKWGEKPYGVQNFGAAVLGSLNSVEGLSSTEHNTAGMADSILGSANRTKNANGTIMVGAGNVVEDSINDFDASEIKTKNGIASPNALSEAMRNSIKKANGGGAAAIVGNGNEVKQSTNVAVVGSKNSVTSTTNSQIFGDNRVVTGADGATIDGAVIIGSADATTPMTTDKKNVTILGHNANATVEGGVAIGAGSVASREAGVAGYDPATKTDSTASSATWKATDAAVSVGKADGTMTRQITGVAAGTKATDAVNVAQLKQVSDGINNNINANKVHYYSVKSKYQDDKSNYNNNGAKGQESIVLGIYSSSDAGYSTVIGMGSSAKKRGTSQASGMYDTVVGQYLDTTGSYNSVFGTFYQNGSIQQLTQVYGDRNTVLGAGNIVGIGKNNTKVKSDENVVIGLNNSVAGSGSIIVGNATTVNGPATMNATSFGHVNTIYDQQEGGGQWGVALGNHLTVKGEYALAVGNNSTAQGDETVAVGYNANASVAGGAAIGSGSVASVDKGVEGYKPNSSVDTSTDPAGTWKSTDAAVSVGKADGSMTRQITGVAAGTNATDAVNVAQLKQAVAGAKDGNDTLKSDKNALKLDGNTLSMSVKDTAGNEVSGSVELSQIAQAVDTNTTYTLSGQANQDNNTTTITLKDSNGRENSVTVATKDTDTRNTVKAGENVTLDTKDNSDGSHEYTVHVKADGKVEADSTKIVSGGTVYNETRVQKDGTYVKASNTAGENLTALDSQVASNAGAVNELNGRVNRLDSRINKVGAGAAALAALHPLDFNPDDKWDFAVGYGNYRNANSVALGAFYRPNENTMLSLGTNFGNGENMFNAGVSFKIGKGNSYAGYSKVEMAKVIDTQSREVAALKEENAKNAKDNAVMKAEIEALKKQVEALAAKK